jgi:DNA/RNA-binding domain of Phe-tRNA-synthetase-like protein
LKFRISEDVFAKLENACFGVVVAKGIANHLEYEAVTSQLENSIQNIADKFANVKVKDSKEIAPYREAFAALGINPNKFLSSIEAMASRIEKGKGFPQINPVVDLGNAVSLKYLVPLGAHDLDQTENDIVVRFSQKSDRFMPFGQDTEELLDEGELIYSVGDHVKTRRWIWRQSELGKVTSQSKNIFFPIDGFENQNYDRVMGARDELAALLQTIFGCSVTVGFVNRESREMKIEL